MLTRDQIIASAASLKKEEIEIPEWDGKIIIREFTGSERDEVESALLRGQKQNTMTGIRARIVAIASLDENGKQLFDPKKDIQLISELSSSALELISSRVLKLSGMNPGADEEGNFGKIITDGPGSD